MYLLSFETSCDDTSICIFHHDKLISMQTASQVKTHNETSGVVPEIAAREHANNIFSVIKKVLEESELTLEQIDYYCVTVAPGLVTSLLTGITVAKTLAEIYKKPIFEINHIKGHIFSNLIERNIEKVKMPAITLTTSGAHSDLFFMKSFFELEKIGNTIDDAAGEAFDKVAKMLGLGYPGGLPVSLKAKSFREKGNNRKKIFPVVLLDKETYNFSFSGLKSAVKREIDSRKLKNGELTENDIEEICFEFEECITEILTIKTINAAKNYKVKSILLAGGVSANDRLREKISLECDKNGFEAIFPVKKVYCTDNAAMIGINAYYNYLYKVN